MYVCICSHIALPDDVSILVETFWKYVNVNNKMYVN